MQHDTTSSGDNRTPLSGPLSTSSASYTYHPSLLLFPFPSVTLPTQNLLDHKRNAHRIVPFVQVVTARLGIPTLILRFIICYLFVITIVSLWQAVDPTSAHNTNEMVDYGAEVMQDYLVRTFLLPFSAASTSLE